MSVRAPQGRMRLKYWTEGERRVAFAYVAFGITGAALTLFIAISIGRNGWFRGAASGYDLWLLVAGFTGTTLALRQVSWRFGHPGIGGLARALGAMLIVTLAAPVIAGTLALPLYGTMFGPFALFVTFAGAPFLAAVWFAMLASVHLLFFTLRGERESIFLRARF